MSNEKQQTAVEWLLENIAYMPMGFEIDIIEQAKAMEKEQIKDAWIARDNELQRLAAEQYYNETFKKD
jgi:hypothetical protein